MQEISPEELQEFRQWKASKTTQFDFSKFDWSIPAPKLAALHNVPYAKVLEERKRLNLPRPSSQQSVHPACLNWDYSLPDSELARTHKTAVRIVRHWRNTLKKPQPSSTRLPPSTKPRHPSSHYASLNWNLHDSLLASQNNLSRERIRQIRAELGLPKANRHSSYQKFTALFPPASTPSLSLKQAKQLLPHLSQTTFNRYCAKANIQRTTLPNGNTKYPWHLVNLSLPPHILASIWLFPVRSIHQARARNYPTNPIWSKSPLLPHLLTQEQSKASAYHLTSKKPKSASALLPQPTLPTPTC